MVGQGPDGLNGFDNFSDLRAIRGFKICLPSYANICDDMINEKNMRYSRLIFGVQLQANCATAR